MFGVYDYIYGVAQLAAGFLAIMAGIVCIPVFLKSKSRKLQAWKPLIISLVLFIILEIIGGVRTFGVVPDAGFWKYSVHVLVSAILALMIGAVAIQTRIIKGWYDVDR